MKTQIAPNPDFFSLRYSSKFPIDLLLYSRCHGSTTDFHRCLFRTGSPWSNAILSTAFAHQNDLVNPQW